jgi:hypothetical protein
MCTDFSCSAPVFDLIGAYFDPLDRSGCPYARSPFHAHITITSIEA